MSSARRLQPAIFHPGQHLSDGEPAEPRSNLAQDLDQKRIAEVHEHRLHVFMEIQPMRKTTANEKRFRQGVLLAEFAKCGESSIAALFRSLAQLVIRLQR